MIEIKNVSFKYSGERADNRLQDVNVTISKGECVLLCGPSGCGKTTLTRLMNGLIPHYYEGELTGEVQVCGKNISDQPLYETAAIIGSVFQNPRSQFFNVDTASELSFACENLGMPEDEIRKRVQQTVVDLQIETLVGRSIFHLSGGEKQKIACASVMTLQPEVYVLDEPSSNLDMEAIDDLRQMLSFWKGQGKTIVIAEHRLHYLRGVVDRILYMDNGRVTSEYSFAQLHDIPPQERQFMGLRVLDLAHAVDQRRLVTEPSNQPEAMESNGVAVAIDLSKQTTVTGLGIQIMELHRFCFAYKRQQQCLRVDQVKLPMNGVIAIIGHNGAGKSTLARCLCGLERRSHGYLQVNGMTYNRRKRLQTTFMVMQDVNHQLFTESVLDEVLLSMGEADQSRAEEILGSLGLRTLKDMHPMSLSGGQKQRVAIACAIASEREVIVFDEPTSGLDWRHMQEVADNLSALQQSGKTLFVITHDPELILCCCTHVLQLHGGEIIANYSLDQSGTERMLEFFDANTSVMGEVRYGIG